MARRMPILSLLGLLAALVAASASLAGSSDLPAVHWAAIGEDCDSGFCHTLHMVEARQGHPPAERAIAQSHRKRAGMRLRPEAGVSNHWKLTPARPRGRRLIRTLVEHMNEDGEVTVKFILVGGSGRSKTPVHITGYNQRCNPHVTEQPCR